MLVHEHGRMRAPEFPSSLSWIQGEQKSMHALRGKVVLLHFWTYAGAHSLRTVPHVARWHAAYEKEGLVVVGIHTPEFTFEKNPAEVKKACERLGITYAVALDNEYLLWKAYGNRVWPKYILINSAGTVVYDAQGDGAYATTEISIQEELQKNGAHDLPAIGSDDSSAGRIHRVITDDQHCGFLRGSVHNVHDVLPEEEMACNDMAPSEEETGIFLHGHWSMHPEYSEHTRDISGNSEYIRIAYKASSMGVVIEPGQGGEQYLEVIQNGLPLAPEMRGADVRERGGKTEIVLDGPRAYDVVQSHTHHAANVHIAAGKKGTRFYRVTFGDTLENKVACRTYGTHIS